MVNGKLEATQNMINKLQHLKGKTKLKFIQSISKIYEEMNFRRVNKTFQFEEDPFSTNAINQVNSAKKSDVYSIIM